MHIFWIVLIGFVAGVLAKLVTPGDNEPQGFILTTVLGIVGAFVATYLGQAIGWDGPDPSAGMVVRAPWRLTVRLSTLLVAISIPASVSRKASQGRRTLLRPWNCRQPI